VVQQKRSLRILALHGFAQSGDYLRTALRTFRLSQYLTEYIDADLFAQYDGVEWLCPDGPVKLNSSSSHEANETEDIDMYAWWRSLDFEQRHDQLEPSMAYLSDYVKSHGPVDGVVGFSQGAAMATMFAPLCEGTQERLAALALQGSPTFCQPPQHPLKFLISCCGFQTSSTYYAGFYTPRLTTPSLHFVAEFDTMVSEARTTALADACENARSIRFRGSHYVPSDRATLRDMAAFIANTCIPQQGMVYHLPPQAFDKSRAVLTLKDGYASSTESGPSSPSRSASSSFSSCSRRTTQLRIIRKSSTIRRVQSCYFNGMRSVH